MKKITLFLSCIVLNNLGCFGLNEGINKIPSKLSPGKLLSGGGNITPDEDDNNNKKDIDEEEKQPDEFLYGTFPTVFDIHDLGLVVDNEIEYFQKYIDLGFPKCSEYSKVQFLHTENHGAGVFEVVTDDALEKYLFKAGDPGESKISYDKEGRYVFIHQDYPQVKGLYRLTMVGCQKEFGPAYVINANLQKMDSNYAYTFFALLTVSMVEEGFEKVSEIEIPLEEKE